MARSNRLAESIYKLIFPSQKYMVLWVFSCTRPLHPARQSWLVAQSTEGGMAVTGLCRWPLGFIMALRKSTLKLGPTPSPHEARFGKTDLLR